MLILINLVIALLAGALVRLLLVACKITDPVNILIAILVGILIYIANLGVYL